MTSNWTAEIGYRRSYVGRRAVRLRRQPLRWAHSTLRSCGDFLWGAFVSVQAAG